MKWSKISDVISLIAGFIVMFALIGLNINSNLYVGCIGWVAGYTIASSVYNLKKKDKEEKKDVS